MADRPKYVVVELASGSHEIRIFGQEWEHSDKVRQPLETPVSGGFVQLFVEDGKVRACCYGKSHSLKVESRPKEDADLVERLFGIGQYED